MVCGHDRCGPQAIELRAELTSSQTRNPAWKVIGFREDSGVAGGWPPIPLVDRTLFEDADDDF